MNPYRKIRDFHGARALGIGSSDIPILAGFGKQYGDTPLTLYLEKTGQKERRSAGPRAEWGHRLEGLILAKWCGWPFGGCGDARDCVLVHKATSEQRQALIEELASKCGNEWPVLMAKKLLAEQPRIFKQSRTEQGEGNA